MTYIFPELLESGVTVPAAGTCPGGAPNLMSICFLVLASKKALAFYDSPPLPESFMLIGNLPSPGIYPDEYPEGGVAGPSQER